MDLLNRTISTPLQTAVCRLQRQTVIIRARGAGRDRQHIVESSQSVSRNLVFLLSLIVFAVLLGCTASPAEPSSTPTSAPTTAPTAEAAETKNAAVDNDNPVAAIAIGRTYHGADGNRIAEGHGPVNQFEARGIVLSGTPTWVVSAPMGDGIVWVVTLSDGTVEGFHVTAESFATLSMTPSQLPPGMPPLIVVENDTPRLLLPAGDISTLTHAVLLSNGKDMAWLGADGRLHVQQGADVTTLDVNALPDARIMVDEHDRLLFLSGPTDAYGHGVLGDSIEASAVTLVETEPTPHIVSTINMEAGWVIEGIAPIWAKLSPAAEQRSIIVTRANASKGAQIVVYHENGTLDLRGPAIGRGSHWRHQLAIGPFASPDTYHLIDVLTPHIGGHVEFYEQQGDELVVQANGSQFTSHPIGTRNLDMAVAADWSGTGLLELLIPRQNRQSLVAISYQDGQPDSSWEVETGALIVTNLSASALSDGQLAVGVGTADNFLLVWQP